MRRVGGMRVGLVMLVAAGCVTARARTDLLVGDRSRCVEDATSLHCEHQSRSTDGRTVHWQVPVGAPPAAGWPAVILFQGSSFPPDSFWDVAADWPFGAWHQGHVTRALLDHGFAVITPSTARSGHSYWDSNDWRLKDHWENSEDRQFLLQLFDDLEHGAFGSLDAHRLYAAGISSGAYMTSRMAVAFPGRFRALAIQSGSYATCGGPFCKVPATLPAAHPPTLFLHGKRDFIVPLSTMQAYRARLVAQGTPTRAVVDARANHEWLCVAPAEIEAWFSKHP